MNQISRMTWIAPCFAVVALVLAGCGATTQPGTKYNVTDQRVAINGADAVAYFTEGRYVPGSGQYVHAWEGATWQFATEANRDAFAQNPEKYAPQYGGFCAYAAARGSLADTDPEAFTVYQDKLYLNLNKTVLERWRQDIPGEIARADANWPEIMPSPES